MVNLTLLKVIPLLTPLLTHSLTEQVSQSINQGKTSRQDQTRQDIYYHNFESTISRYAVSKKKKKKL